MTEVPPKPPRRKRPSIRDVAAQAGVSTATVSNVFSRKKHVNENLIQRVIRAAEELDYSIDPVASQLRSGRARVIALIVPDLEDLFLNQFVSRMEALAHEAGYEIIVSSSRNDPKVEQSRISAVLGWRPAGIVVAPCGNSLTAQTFAALEGTPVVLADRIEPGSCNIDTVTLDNYLSGYLATDHLVSRGARSLLLVAGTMGLFGVNERIRAARDVAEQGAGVDIQVMDIGPDPHVGSQSIAEWLRKNGKPDAVLGLTNVTTLAALSAFAETGVDVPRDTLLLGFHDSLWMTARKTAITTLQQPVDQVAKACWERLAARMSGDTSAAHNIVLKANLVARASTVSKTKRESAGPELMESGVGGG